MIKILETLQSAIKELRSEIESLSERVKELEYKFSYEGEIIQDSYCNGYFGRHFDLDGAQIVDDAGLIITIKTTDGEYRSAEFDNFEEKIQKISEWLTEREDDK